MRFMRFKVQGSRFKVQGSGVHLNLLNPEP
jgi:hypothetical protein